jgi:hypothetical protein
VPDAVGVEVDVLVGVDVVLLLGVDVSEGEALGSVAAVVEVCAG